MKKILFLISIIGVLLFSLSFVQNSNAEKPEPYKTICHHTPANEVTHNFVNEQSYLGHLGTPHNNETYDTDGACSSPTQHLACASEACVLVNGVGDNTCERDEDCGGITPTHLSCFNQACVTVDGEGSNSCSTNNDCIVTPPTETPSNPGGPGDGLGCATHDCSSHPSTGGQVLGASTVLGLSTTSGEENYALQFIQLFGALTSAGLGLAFFKK